MIPEEEEQESQVAPHDELKRLAEMNLTEDEFKRLAEIKLPDMKQITNAFQPLVDALTTVDKNFQGLHQQVQNLNRKTQCQIEVQQRKSRIGTGNEQGRDDHLIDEMKFEAEVREMNEMNSESSRQYHETMFELSLILTNAQQQMQRKLSQASQHLHTVYNSRKQKWLGFIGPNLVKLDARTAQLEHLQAEQQRRELQEEEEQRLLREAEQQRREAQEAEERRRLQEAEQQRRELQQVVRQEIESIAGQFETTVIRKKYFFLLSVFQIDV